MTQRPYRGRPEGFDGFVYGDHLNKDGKSYIVCDFETDCPDGENTDLYATDWFEVDPSTVGQYTGRMTFDDKTVFRGDKLQFVTFNHDGSDNGIQTGYVEWDESISAFVVVDADDGDKSYWLYLVFENDDSVEIIGNRWEELLEGTKP